MNRASIIACVCLVSAARLIADDEQSATSFAKKPRAATVARYCNWMSRLKKDVRLSELSIPGTHDSCATHDGFSLGFAKCQTWKLADQLRAGIRFIDIRCRHLNDRFQIYHGVIDQHMTFDQVNKVCREFLSQHPTECILMSVKEESKPEGNSRSFAETFSASIKSDRRVWHIDKTIPKLADVRGRIVLIDRVSKLGGLPWSEFDRQDDYQAEIEKKQTLIRSQLRKAINSGTKKKAWSINFCSGTLPSRLVTPRKYAIQTNPVVAVELKRLNLKRKSPLQTGVIVMDFPGEELIEQIVNSNFDRNEKSD